MKLPDGLYDLLITRVIADEIKEAHDKVVAPAEGDLLKSHLSKEIFNALEAALVDLPDGEKIKLANSFLDQLGASNVDGQAATILKCLHF